MSTITLFTKLLSNNYVLALLAIGTAYLISIRMYPVIIYLSHQKNLMDEPGERSMHSLKTPTLGGIGMFGTFSIALILYGLFMNLAQPELIKILSILGATIILLFLGVKDDLIVLSPRKKFSGQIIASIIVILITDVRIRDMYGLFGIGELPYVVSVLLTLLVIIFIINAYNLIDGIDGLAGSIGILSSFFFGIYFLAVGDKVMIVSSTLLIGTLIGFLSYNLSKSRKLFMGDTGSMFVGFMLAYQAVYFIGMDGIAGTALEHPAPPIMAMAIMCYPILDTMRVFIIRISRGINPFHGDRSHIHHRLLFLGLRHKQATSLIVAANFLVVLLTFFTRALYVNLQLYILIVLILAIFLFPMVVVREGGKYKMTLPRFR